MMRTAEFTFLQHEQANAAAWEQVNAFAKAWNKGFDPKFVNTMDFLWIIEFRDQGDPAFVRFSNELAALRSRYSVQYHVTSKTHFNQEDYRAADFVEILGISLEGIKGRPFVLNQQDALGPPAPCPRCGWQDMFSVPQMAPFAIDEGLLDHAQADGGTPPVGGWDCVNLPNGHKLVSSRITELFEKEAVRGWEVLPVLAGSTGKESTRVFQLLANRSVLQLHQLSLGTQVTFCPVCGAALSLPSDYDTTILQPPLEFCIRKGQVERDELFSRHPGRGAMLYVSNRVYLLLLGARLRDVYPSEVINYCPPPS